MTALSRRSFPEHLWSRRRSWISEIVGGGPNESSSVLRKAYLGRQRRPLVRSDRHTGKLDRVRLVSAPGKPDKLEVARFDMVSGVSVEFWHNKTV